MAKQLSNLWAGFVLTLVVVFTANGQEYNSFEIRYQNNIKGDLTFIGNQIVNRDAGVAGRGQMTLTTTSVLTTATTTGKPVDTSITTITKTCSTSM